MNRRQFLTATACCLGSSAAWAGGIEPNWFELSRTRISVPGIRPTRLLHISDLHVSDGMTAPQLERGLAVGLAQRPDVICFTGDYVTTTTGFDRPGLLRMLRRAAGTAPSFAVMGNHDGGDWLHRHGGNQSSEPMRDLIASAGVTVLHNQAAMVNGLRLVGVADYWSGQFDPHAAFGTSDAGASTIALCHNPDAKSALRQFPWELMLSGHTHGGQARIPGLNPLWTPVDDPRFLAGLYSWQGRQLFITRGLGSPRHVRLFCRPEASLLELA